MKITIKLILLFLIPGLLLFHGMYFIQTMSNLHNANNEISDIMEFVAEQCARYDNLMETVKYKVEEFTGMHINKINIYVEGVRVID